MCEYIIFFRSYEDKVEGKKVQVLDQIPPLSPPPSPYRNLPVRRVSGRRCESGNYLETRKTRVPGSSLNPKILVGSQRY